MKNKILLLIASFVIHVSSKSQLIDSCIIKCKYSFTFQKDSLNPLFFGNDLMVLEIGKKTSFFYSQYRKLGDSLINEDQKRGLTGADVSSNRGKYFLDKWSIFLAKNYPENENTVTEILIQPYLYKEKEERQNWEILQDTLTLFGLKCQKAITKYRGRKYEAWFTKEIALSNGPWKFYGLPGLIIKVHDTNKQFDFELNGIEILKNKEPMIIPEKKYIVTTRMTLWNLKKRSTEDPIGFLENYSGLGIKVSTPMSPREMTNRKKPYNPIELE